MTKKHQNDPDEVIEDARFVAGVLNLMEAALITADGRETLGDQDFWVVMDAGQRMKGILKILEEIT